MVKTKTKKQKHNRKSGAAYTDSAVKILISVVVGATVLFGIIGLMANVVLPTTNSKVNSLFNTEGGSSGGSGGSGGGGTGGGAVTYSIVSIPADKLPAGSIDGSVATSVNGTTAVSFRSDAPKSKFSAVKVDDQVVSAENYAVTEGSTIVTFNGTYIAQLSTGEHTLSVVSTDGSATGSFNKITAEALPNDTVAYLGVQSDMLANALQNDALDRASATSQEKDMFEFVFNNGEYTPSQYDVITTGGYAYVYGGGDATDWYRVKLGLSEATPDKACTGRVVPAGATVMAGGNTYNEGESLPDGYTFSGGETCKINGKTYTYGMAMGASGPFEDGMNHWYLAADSILDAIDTQIPADIMGAPVTVYFAVSDTYSSNYFLTKGMWK